MSSCAGRQFTADENAPPPRGRAGRLACFLAALPYTLAVWVVRPAANTRATVHRSVMGGSNIRSKLDAAGCSARTASWSV